jgi:hypothetical protein
MRPSAAGGPATARSAHWGLPRRCRTATAAGVASVGLGGWLLLAPFVLDHGFAARWNGIFVGTFIVAFGAFLGLLGLRRRELSGLLGALSGWLLVAPLVLPYGAVASLSDRVTGGVLMALAVLASPTVGPPPAATRRR